MLDVWVSNWNFISWKALNYGVNVNIQEIYGSEELF